jgi:hypothetical protein
MIFKNSLKDLPYDSIMKLVRESATFPGELYFTSIKCNSLLNLLINELSFEDFLNLRLVSIQIYQMTREYLVNNSLIKPISNSIFNQVSDLFSLKTLIPYTLSDIPNPKTLIHNLTFDERKNTFACTFFLNCDDDNFEIGPKFLEIFEKYFIGKIIINLPKNFTKKTFNFQFHTDGCHALQVIINAKSSMLRLM